MRKFYCDVCGREMPPIVPDKANPTYSAFDACECVHDVCADCEAAGRILGVEDIVLAAWRKAVGAVHGCGYAAADAREAGPVPEPVQVQSSSGTPVSVPGACAGESDPCPADESERSADDGAVAPGLVAGGPEQTDCRPADIEDAGMPAMDESSGQEPSGQEPSGQEPSGQEPSGQEPSGQEVPARRRSRWKSTEVPSSGAGQPDAGPKEVPKRGGHWARKREIAERLAAYRTAHGLGSTQAIANASGLSADLIRSMLNAQPQSIDVWRKVEAGLNKLEKAGAAG